MEHRSQKLLPRREFINRLLAYAAVALGIILFGLSIGILGYHYLEGVSWIDALLNASMLLGGMGPVSELHTTAGKLFASFYALFAGVIFLVATGVLFTPIFHRFLHRFHLDLEEQDD